MTAYIIRRLIQGLLVIIIASFLLFIAVRFLPGDPVLIHITESARDRATPAEIEALRQEFGLDRPVMVQYFDWLSDVFRGDLGKSIVYGTEVTRLIARALPVTVHLGILAFALSIIIGIPAGVISAVRRGRAADTLTTTVANLGITVPVFWLGILLIYLFSLNLGLLPTSGYTSPFEDFSLSTKQLLLPVFCLSIFTMAAAARQTRSSMLEVIRQDYIRTAWSKGLGERDIILKHALKNGLIPVVTFLGMGVSHIFGGSVLIETVFNIPGMGRLGVSALGGQDYPVVQGVALIIAVVVVLANIIVDISYGWLDPRIRYGREV